MWFACANTIIRTRFFFPTFLSTERCNGKYCFASYAITFATNSRRKWNRTKFPILNNSRFQAIAGRLHYHRHHHCICAKSRDCIFYTISNVYVNTWLLAAASAYAVRLLFHWLCKLFWSVGVAFSCWLFRRRTWNMKLHFLVSKKKNKEKKSGPFSLIILIISALIYYKRHWMKANSSWNPTKGRESHVDDALAMVAVSETLSFEPATSINRKQNTLQLILHGWKTTFSFRPHTHRCDFDLKTERAVFHMARSKECRRKSGNFIVHIALSVASQTPYVHPLVRFRSVLSSEKSNRNVKRLFLLTSD